MPRRAPINPEGYYHVSTSGNFGQPMFQTRGEHQLYLDLYAKSARKFGFRTLAYALIWNHNHFVIKLTDDGLSEGMRRVNHGFARRLNAIYGRTNRGHMVRHCFYARELADEDDLLTVCRYVDLNPVAAKLCTVPEQWPWSSYAATIGMRPPRAFHQPADLLRLFSPRPARARERYAQFVTQGSSPGKVAKAQRDSLAA